MSTNPIDHSNQISKSSCPNPSSKRLQRLILRIGSCNEVMHQITSFMPEKMPPVEIARQLISSSQIEESVRRTRLNDSLDHWCNEVIGTREYQARITAVKKITACYEESIFDLDLSNLNLTSLPEVIGELRALQTLDLSGNHLNSIPEVIGELRALQRLDLSGNRLISLPEAIGELIALQRLDLNGNDLTSIPEAIGELIALQTLDLSGNCLTSIPEAIGKLRALQMFYLNRNQLISLPEAIGKLTALQSLNLSDNDRLTSIPETMGKLTALQRLNLSGSRFTSLPEVIGKLRALQWLDLSRNQLTSLPEAIGELTTLQWLDLSDNRLASLSLGVLNLPLSTDVDITRCPFSETALTRLRRITSAPEYPGPRIIYSIFEERDHNSNRSLDELLEELYQPQQTAPSLTRLRTLDGDSAVSLRSWLNRLSDIADFRVESLKASLVRKVTEYLELADQNPQFLDQFLAIINDAGTTCGDKMALSIIYLGVAKRLATVDLDNPQELAHLLIHGVWIVKQLETIAFDKMATMMAYDDIEVILGYLIQLKDRLSLPLDVQDMLYYACSNLLPSDIDAAETQVLTTLQSDEKYKFLVRQELWNKALEKKDPNAYQLASRVYLENGNIQPLVDLTKNILESVSTGSASLE